MTQHADILDQPEQLGRPFVGSILFHLTLVAVIAGATWMRIGSTIRIGEQTGGGAGSVAVNVVNSIPLPPRPGPTNPLANDSQSQAPAPPPKTKPAPKVKTPPTKAIEIPDKNAKTKRPTEAAAAPNRLPSRPVQENQIYSNQGQAANTPLFNKPGAGGVGIGTNSPFGDRFGAYATLLFNRIGQNWHTNDIPPNINSAPPVVVVFTMRANGSLVPGSVRVLQSSGNRSIDFSAQRAVLDSEPLPQFPPGFGRDQVNIEASFQLRR